MLVVQVQGSGRDLREPPSPTGGGGLVVVCVLLRGSFHVRLSFFPRSLRQVVNTAERGAIRLLKTDAMSGEALAGATFAIYRVEEDGTVAVEPSDTKVSSADGQVVDAGRVNNERIRADIIAYKVDSHTHAGLAGATFALEREGQRIATATSDADGLVTFTDVEYGTYTIREERAPRVYALSDTRLTAVVSQNGVFVDAGTIENQFVVGQSASARTGMDAEVVRLECLVGAIGVGILLGARRRRVSQSPLGGHAEYPARLRVPSDTVINTVREGLGRAFAEWRNPPAIDRRTIN